jgi:WD40 repeat protein
MSSSLAIQPFNSLPIAVLSQTLGELDNSNLLKARLVCKLFYQAAGCLLVNRKNASGKSLFCSFDLSLKRQGIFDRFQNGIYTKKSFTAYTRAISIIEPQKEGILTVAEMRTVIGMWNEKGEILNVFGGTVELNEDPMRHTETITGLQVVKDHFYTSSLDGTVKQWSLKDQKCVSTFKCHEKGISCFKVEEGILYTGSADSTVKKWDVNTKERLEVFAPFFLKRLPNKAFTYGSTPFAKDNTLEQDGVAALTICQEKLYIAYHTLPNAIAEEIVVVWDLKDHKPVYLIYSMSKGRVEVHNLQKKSLQIFETTDPARLSISHLRIHADKIFTVFSANIIHIIDLKNKSFKSINNSNEGVLTGFEMMEDRLLSMSAEGIVKLWDLDGTLLKTLQWVAKKAVYSISFKDKKMFLGFVDGKVRVIDYSATDKEVLMEIARKFASGKNMASRLQAMPELVQNSIMKQFAKIEKEGLKVKLPPSFKVHQKKKNSHFSLFKKNTSESSSSHKSSNRASLKLFAKAIVLHLEKEGKE